MNYQGFSWDITLKPPDFFLPPCLVSEKTLNKIQENQKQKRKFHKSVDPGKESLLFFSDDGGEGGVQQQ